MKQKQYVKAWERENEPWRGLRLTPYRLPCTATVCEDLNLFATAARCARLSKANYLCKVIPLVTVEVGFEQSNLCNQATRSPTHHPCLCLPVLAGID